MEPLENSSISIVEGAKPSDGWNEMVYTMELGNIEVSVYTNLNKDVFIAIEGVKGLLEIAKGGVIVHWISCKVCKVEEGMNTANKARQVQSTRKSQIDNQAK